MEKLLDNKKLITAAIYAGEDRDELFATLSSVYTQSCKNAELVVIVSNNHEKEITEDCFSELSAVKNLPAELISGKSLKILTVKNKGIVNAFNEAVYKSSGEYIIFLKASQELKAGCLSQLYDNITAQDLELSFCGLRLTNQSGYMTTYVPEEELSLDIESFLNTLFLDAYDKKLFSFCGNKLFKRAFLADNRLIYDSGLYENRELCFNFEILDHCDSVGIVKYDGLRHSMHGGENVLDLDSRFELLTDYNELFNSYDVDDEVINDMNNRMLELILDGFRKLYAESELEDAEKERILTAFCKRSELIDLVKDTNVEGVFSRLAAMFIRFGNINALKNALKLQRSRQNVMRVVALGEVFEASLHRHVVKNEQAEPEVAISENEQPESEDEQETSESELKEPGDEACEEDEKLPELSDEELDKIGEILESNLDDEC